MEKWKERLETLSETVTVTKLDGTLLLAICGMAGIIIGMLISPRKNARYGCNNGNTEINHFDEDWDDEDMWEDDETLSFK